jgi:hypothetical protein
MTQPEISIHVQQGTADAAQLAAWRWLWQRLLGETVAENAKPLEASPPRGPDERCDDTPLLRRSVKERL